MTRMNICALALAVWLVFLVLAVALGAVREAVLLPALGEPAAHVVGTLLVVAAMLAVMVPFVRRVRPHGTTTDLWLIGLLWMTLTVAFEFLFFISWPGCRGACCWPTTTSSQVASGCWFC